ncbi:hypothetical protein SBA7_80015 [Candidatus Sulfotelmatobacter sp. SbA7]|nr:hypothetical protein SBA7_80015 [Candidatus Sulfotelmatobacter sp. SbA7]
MDAVLESAVGRELCQGEALDIELSTSVRFLVWGSETVVMSRSAPSRNLTARTPLTA